MRRHRTILASNTARVRLRTTTRRGSVAVLFAFSVIPLLIGLFGAIDIARLADTRAALQYAVDNAALAGAAVYTADTPAAQQRAIVSATAAFCEMTATLPTAAAVSGGGQQACSTSNPGPTVATQFGVYVAGTPGLAPSACDPYTPVANGMTCGFIVTVSAQASLATSLPGYLGANASLSVSAKAANPFLDLGTAIKAQIFGSALNTNSIWIYPLMLDANGNPDFSTNSGAIPQLVAGTYPADASPSGSGCGNLSTCGPIGRPAGVNCASNGTACGSAPPSGCTDDPMQFACGFFAMLASTYYNTVSNPCPASAPCYPNGPGTYPQIIAGVVQHPLAPAAVITASTPIGLAFESIAGGAQGYGYGGYQANPANGCLYPGNAVYTTVSQVFGNTLNAISGGHPGLDWPKVTHWFYSSYLLNGYPPDYGEIQSQSALLSYTPPGGSTIYYNTRIPSLGSNVAGSFSPSLAACAQPAGNGASYDEYLTTSYPSAGATNASLFVLQQPAGSAYIPPASTGYAYQRYAPGGTPGFQYAALSCQNYGTKVYSFYWNDMSGSQGSGDDLDYNNGTVRITCSGASLVRLIQ